jgi:restriction system protein
MENLSMSLSMADAAYTILKESNEPLHYAFIVNQMISRGLVSTKGLTPGASLLAIISRENSKRVQSGDLPRFEPLGDGVYGLTEWRPVEIERRIQEINHTAREELWDRISKMPPKAFEEMIGELLIAIGFDEETVEVTGRSGDGGIDVIGVMDIEGVTRIDAAVQVKRVKNNIPADRITALRGSLLPNQRGIFITTSNFTKQAIQEASAVGKSPISLVNIGNLLDLCFKFDIGVKRQEHTIYEIDSEYWPESPSSTAPVISPINQKILKQVSVNYPLEIFVRHKGQKVEASLLETGQVVLNGQTHTSVSAAGIAVTGWKSCNGWSFWMFINPGDGAEYLIDVLRSPKG